MKVLLIYPKFPNTFWSFSYALNFIGKKAAFPPLGLLTVAALLPEAWEKFLVDMNVKNLKDKDLVWADIVFVGGMTIQRRSAEQVIARCTALNLKVIAGEPLFTSEPDQCSATSFRLQVRVLARGLWKRAFSLPKADVLDPSHQAQTCAPGCHPFRLTRYFRPGIIDRFFTLPIRSLHQPYQGRGF